MPSNYCILEMHITNFIFQKMYSQITSVDTHARAPRGGFFTGNLKARNFGPTTFGPHL